MTTQLPNVSNEIATIAWETYRVLILAGIPGEDIVLRGLVDAHVDFQTEDFDFWISVYPEHADCADCRVQVKRHNRKLYCRDVFTFWPNQEDIYNGVLKRMLHKVLLIKDAA